MNSEEEKLFSLHEAQELLPELKRRILRLRELRKALEQNAPHIHKLAGRGRENAGSAVGTTYLLDLLAFQEEWKAFMGTGCLLRDLDRGLLDFPALLNGKKIYLCWVWGEDAIGWWHDLDTGFSGRQPLD